MAFLRGSDPKRFGSLIVSLDNDFLHGQDKFPTTIVQATTLLMHYKRIETKRNNNNNNNSHKNGNNNNNSNNNNDETRDDAETTEEDEGNHNFFMAHGTNDDADYTENNLDYGNNESDDETMFLQIAHAFAQSNGRLPISWVLLDSESTVSIFGNEKLLINIRKIPKHMKPLQLYTNGGVMETDMIGDLIGFGTVWFCRGSLANILSLAHVRKICRVTMDTKEAPAFFVHRKDGSTITFKEHKRGLYVCDTAAIKPKASTTDYSFVETVADNKTKFSARDVKGAEKARKVLALIGRPSQAEYLDILQNHRLRNSPVEHMNAQHAQAIFGPEKDSLKGKTVRRQAMQIKEFVPVPLPASLMQYYRHITICTDVFYVHKLPFLHTISRHLMFRTQRPLADRHSWTVIEGLKKVIQIYSVRGFIVKHIHADNEFECIKNEFNGVSVNVCGENEHVPEVERSIRTMKERVRCSTHALPYRYYPKQLIQGLVQNACIWLNAFPNKNGVSKDLSPRAIVTGRETDFKIDCRVEIGSYCQVTENNEPNVNSQEERSRDAIALHSTGNRQGSYYFLAIDTWEKIKRNQWTELPLPSNIINVVNQRGKDEGRAPIKRVSQTFLFEWRPRNKIFDEDEDQRYEETEDDDDEDYDPEHNNDENDHENDSENDNPHRIGLKRMTMMLMLMLMNF